MELGLCNPRKTQINSIVDCDSFPPTFSDSKRNVSLRYPPSVLFQRNPEGLHSLDPLYLDYVYTTHLLCSTPLSQTPSRSPFSGPYHPSPIPVAASHPRIPSAKYVKVLLTKRKCSSVTRVTPHTDCLLPPLTTIPDGTWQCPGPICTPSAPSSQVTLRHLRLPSHFLASDSA